MADATTANRNIPYPNGEDRVNQGPAEMEAIAKNLDEENAGDVDFLEAGVVTQSDWSFTATINGSTAAITSEASTGGTAWIPSGIGLTRSVTATSSASVNSVTVSSKPASGKFMCIGVELAQNKWGKAATSSIVSGVEKNTKAEAEAASPAVTANHIRIRDIIIKNTAAVYSIEAQFDRRTFVSQGFGGLTAVEKNANYAALPGQWVRVSGSHTITVPSIPTAKALIGITSLNGSGSAPVTITVPGAGSFVGKGILPGTKSLLLGAQGTFLLLLGDGSNWYVIGGEADTGWIAMGALSNSYTGSEVEPPRYRRKGNTVYLGGSLSHSAPAGQVAFTLPEGFRPSQILNFPAMNSNFAISACVIQPEGSISLSTISGGAVTFANIDGVSFLIE